MPLSIRTHSALLLAQWLAIMLLCAPLSPIAQQCLA